MNIGFKNEFSKRPLWRKKGRRASQHHKIPLSGPARLKEKLIGVVFTLSVRRPPPRFIPKGGGGRAGTVASYLTTGAQTLAQIIDETLLILFCFAFFFLVGRALKK